MTTLASRARLAILSGALVMLVLLGSAGRCAQAAEAVLLSSTAPGYAPGMVIAAGDALTLPDGASVTLLFRSGQMLHLHGPFRGSLERAQPPAGKADAPALAELFRMQGVDATVIGGTRTTGTAFVPASAGDVQIDPQRSATYCLAPSDAIWIGRPAGDAEAYGLRRRTNQRAIAWPAGAERIEWPDDVPIEDGDRFEIVADGKPRATIGFRVLDGKFPSEAAWIAAGELSGCHEQFEGKLRRLGEATVPPELWLTSTRGRTPTYRSGEPIGLTVQADTDGYLYCVARQGDGSAVPIFPAGAVDGARLRGAVPVSIPGGRRGGELRAGPPGTAQVTCWLADHDISPELPHALLDHGGGRLPDRLAENLDAVFSGISGRTLPKAELTIRVE